MTPTEAIQKEIEREEQELKDIDAEHDELVQKMVDAMDDKAKRDALIPQLREVARRQMNASYEIEGKKLALAAVTAKPNDPVGAIDAEYDAEYKKAAELGRKAQALREKIFLDRPPLPWDPNNPPPPPPKETVDELAKLNEEFEAEMARLRGKSIARGVASAALKSG